MSINNQPCDYDSHGIIAAAELCEPNQPLLERCHDCGSSDDDVPIASPHDEKFSIEAPSGDLELFLDVELG